MQIPGQTLSTEAEILANPLYPIDAATYLDYHRTMTSMENELSSMHRLVNSLFEKQTQLESLINAMPATDKFKAVKADAEALLKKKKRAEARNAFNLAVAQGLANAMDDPETPQEGEAAADGATDGATDGAGVVVRNPPVPPNNPKARIATKTTTVTMTTDRAMTDN